MLISWYVSSNTTLIRLIVNRTSASNCAAVYNQSLTQPQNQPKNWEFSFNLWPEDIWEGISHLAILEHYKKEGDTLTVPHGLDQKDQLAEAIQKHDQQFDNEGQPEWAHYCEKCIRWTKVDEEGQPLGE